MKTSRLISILVLCAFGLFCPSRAEDIAHYFSRGGTVTISNPGLTNTHIFVGSASNLAIDVPLSGDATMANTGALSLSTTAVTPGSYLLSGITVDSKGRLTAASSATLASANIWVGNGSNVPTAVAVSGDATMANTGALTLANSGVSAGSCTACNLTIDAKGRVIVQGNGAAGSSGVQFDNDATYNAAGSPYTLTSSTAEVLLVDSSGGTVILNLPTVASTKWKVYYIACTTGNGHYVQLIPNGTDKVNGVNGTIFHIANVTGVNWLLVNTGTQWICTTFPQTDYNGSGAATIPGLYYGSNGCLQSFTAANAIGKPLLDGSSGIPKWGFTVEDVVSHSGNTSLNEASERNQKCDATGGAFNLTLPDATTCVDKRINATKIDASGNAITINTTGGQTISGAASVSLAAQWNGWEGYSDGSNWITVSTR